MKFGFEKKLVLVCLRCFERSEGSMGFLGFYVMFLVESF